MLKIVDLAKGKKHLVPVMLTAGLMGLAGAAGAQTTPTYTIPDVTGFHSTFQDTQTFATNLVDGPGRDAIYVGLVLAGFGFVWRMIRKGIGH